MNLPAMPVQISIRISCSCRCSSHWARTARTLFRSYMKPATGFSRFTIALGLGLLVGVVLLPSAAAAKKLNVVTSTTDMAALAQEVGGEKVNVESIAKGYQDPHF